MKIVENRFESSIPQHWQDKVVRLPRCANCFDTVHEHAPGGPICVSVALRYRAMDEDTRTRYEQAQAQDDQTRPLSA